MDERDLIRDILAEGHIPGSAASGINNEENRLNTLYADIIVDISHEKLDRTFQYRVPESLRGRLEPGSLCHDPVSAMAIVASRVTWWLRGSVSVRSGEDQRISQECRKKRPGGGQNDCSGCLDPPELRLYHDPGAEDGTAGKTVGEKAGTQTAGTSDEQRGDFVIIRRM